MAKIQNAVAKKEQNAVGKPKTMQQYIKKMEGEIAKALPSVMTPQRFTRMVLTAISSTPELANTTPESFLGAMMTAAQLGLEPNTPMGQAYLIPYNNRRKGVMECQFQLGYTGMINLANRAGVNVDAHEVCENDAFEFAYGLEQRLVHEPVLTNRGNVIAYYATYKTQNGCFGFIVMSREDVVAHAKKYSKSFNSGPWQTNFDEMAKKTCIKKVLKYAPLSADFAHEVAADSTTREITQETKGDDMAFETANMVTANYEVMDDGLPLDPYDMVDGDLAEGEIPLEKYAEGEPDFIKE